MLDMDIIDQLAAALGPECEFTNLTHGRSARPPSLSYPQRPAQKVS